MCEWISVKDDLPKSGTKVVVAEISYGEIIDYATAYYYNSKHGTGWGIEDGGYEARNYDGVASMFLNLKITHWMPLPKPPKD